MNMPLIHISIDYLMFKHLYSMALNLDVAFLLSVSLDNQRAITSLHPMTSI